MAETTPTDRIRTNSSAGHLSVHVEGAHPLEVPFLFEQQQKRLGPAFVASFAYHVAMGFLVLLAIRYGPGGTTSAALLPEQPNSHIVWLNEPGPGGGGGGGGNKMKEPPRPAELPGKAKITVPVVKPPKLEMQENKPEPTPIQQVNIPAKTLAAAEEMLPGAVAAPSAPSA